VICDLAIFADFEIAIFECPQCANRNAWSATKSEASVFMAASVRDEV
jgi:predicted RNA-binding Zn-ribbon protein involved in translation (DUF1610 family)